MDNIIISNGVTLINCTQCFYHKIIADPDPNDWFCDDDVAVVCTLSEKEPDEIIPDSKWTEDRQKFKSSARSCRPYNVKHEAKIPDWCPALKEPLIRKHILPSAHEKL